MLSSISPSSSMYAAQSSLSVSPKIPASLQKTAASAGQMQADSRIDSYQRSDGSVATRNDLAKNDLAKSDSVKSDLVKNDSATETNELTDAEKASKYRDYADKIRRDNETKAEKPKKEQVMDEDEQKFRELLHQFIGQVLFGQMLKSMRATQEPNPYFNGGRAEEIFQGQLDQMLTDQVTKASTQSISDPMYRLMRASKSSN
ncbi:MAG: rod-binding protein [Thermoguttaceae bacterium]